MGGTGTEKRSGSSSSWQVRARAAGDDAGWYAMVKHRTQSTVSIGGLSMIAMLVASQWGEPTHFLIASIWAVVIASANIYYDVVWAKRLGPRAERVRGLVNTIIVIPLCHVIGWPIQSWFWLIFMGVELDATSVRTGIVTLSIMCGVQTVVATADGEPLSTGLFMTAMAFIVWNMSNARTRFIRELVTRTVAQHDALAATHAQLEMETSARTRAEVDLRSAQKLEALGRLAAGVAHEINTPMQFVSDNLEFVTTGTGDLLELAGKCASPEAAADADLDYLQAEMPTSLAQAREGVKRVAAIVRSMKELAHPGGTENTLVDINHAIKNTLVVSSHEYKLIADIDTELAEDLPSLEGNAGELNQVFLNLIVNAAQAIEDVMKFTKRRGRICISTRADRDSIQICIADSGGGIPSPIVSQVFEPFFTTKPVGRGTGQGLAIARAVIERHGGTLTFITAMNIGTTFLIRLPLKAARQDGIRQPTAA